ncbi:MAG: methylmalonate-semialdehyde dehydrogenase (acylating) [Desulfobacteraceae bacterium CG2_30_51_40]|nr:MAG: methylmalonate-semialdehyde dehydrogenase (acylating) [Desulfobacteraceae bacterium CG2_30_51_40]
MAILEEPIKGVPTAKNYINGEWTESKGEMIDVVNPATSEVIGKVGISTKEEIDSAVAAATEAFHDWRRTPAVTRCRYLFRFLHLLEENFEDLSRVQTQEHGKTIDESRGETRRGIENVEVACGIPTLMMGDTSEDIASGIDEYLIRVPLGVFGVIGPFNFPFMIPLWSAPYAVATGNTVVIKPSSEVPFSQTRITELAEEAGFPPGVWNMVHGGRTVVNGMLDHPGISGITFVGSSPVMRDVIYPGCGKTGKRCIAQGGAANILVIMPDCNVEATIPGLMTSFFGNAGQRCLAGQTLIMVGDDDRFYNSFVEKVTERAKAITIGYGLDESVQMGPVRDAGKKEKILGHIESAIKEGVKLRLDGRKPGKIVGGYPDRCFLGPTIMEGLHRQMRAVREEIFGPTMGILRTKTLEEAIEICNESPYHNGHAIFTSNGKHARHFQYDVISGNVGINIGIVAPMAFFPFSGMAGSFMGILHTQGKEAVRFFTESKVCIHRWL